MNLVAQRMAWVTVALTLFPCALVAAETEDVHLTLLRQYAIGTDATSIDKYLRSLNPGVESRQQLRRLIKQLSDDDFFRREEAMIQILRQPIADPEMLQAAKQSNDPDVRWRANQIIKKADLLRSQLMFATFQVINKLKLVGIAEAVLDAIPLCLKPSLLGVAQKALITTVLPQDGDFLAAAVREGDVHRRVSAIKALMALRHETAKTIIMPQLKDSNELIRLTAARSLSNLGMREPLIVLGQLLESDDLQIRIHSSHTLRLLTGIRKDFVAYEEKDKRTIVAKQWQRWIATTGLNAKLIFPLPDRPPRLGRILICFYGQNKIVELDANRKTIWTKTVTNPWGCQGLPNGHRLVASYSQRKIVEFDETGKEIWVKDGLPASPFKVRRLETGNYLVACSDSQKVLEIRPDKTTAWEVTLSGRPMDARPLENGNILVALQNGNQVVEVNREGKIVWKVDNMMHPISIERLENGNTLIAQMQGGKVVEVDQSGSVVWSKDGFKYPYDCQRLENGNTLVVDRTGLREVDKAGNVVWTYAGSNMSGVSSY